MGLFDEEWFRQVFDSLSDRVMLIRREEGGVYRCLEVNEAVSRLEGIPAGSLAGKRLDEIHPAGSFPRWKAHYDRVVETGLAVEVEYVAESPLGPRSRITKLIPGPARGDGRFSILALTREVTETRSAQLDRDAHLLHLEAMNRIGQTLSDDLDLENVLQKVTGDLLDIFSADRAWIADSCDPEAPTFGLAFITSREGIPGPPRHARVPMDEVSRGIVREVRAVDGPLAFDETHPMPGGEAYLSLFGIRSQMLMALRLKGGETWCVGLHQCTHERLWAAKDQALFREAVGRIKDTLQNLLLHRDLKKSREWYHLMTEVLPQLLWTADASGNVDFVNGRWMEYTGLSREQSVGTGGLQVIHPEDVQPGIDCWSRSLVTGEPFVIEQRYRRTDGAYLWHLTRAYPIRDAEGRVSRWIGTCTDISEAKRVQEEAARSRQELAVILQGVDEGISAQDPTGALIFANQRFAEFSGFANPQEFLSASPEERKNRYEFYDESGKALSWQDLPGRRVLQGEDQVQLVMRCKDRKLGVERWMNAKSSSVRGPDGKLAMVINFSQDITSMREAREELIKSRTQLSTILSGIAESIIAYDPTGRIIYANEAAAKLLDQPSPEALIRYSENPPPATEESRYHVFDETGNAVPREKTPSQMALRGVENPPMMVARVRMGPKGRERWILARAKPIFDSEGKVSLVISMTQDITELREKEEAVARLQKMESLGKLAGGIAHDFNNLLVAINGYSEMGISEARTGELPLLEEYFLEILKSGKRAAALTQQLLAYSRRQVVQPKPLHVNAVVGDMEKMLRRLIGEDIQVKTLLAEGLPLVQADPSQLEQVILNLVVNARDAMPEGGTLTLRTEVCSLDQDQLLGNPDAKPGTFISLSVSDTGFGMSPEVMERAFEPFFTTKPPGKGTGLGLASVYGIVKQSGGHIQVQSRPGTGSSFSIFLPASGEKAALPAGTTASPALPRGRGTILLVEDEESVRTFTRRVLEGRGYEVIAARDGLEALELAKDRPPFQLLLTDEVMPGMRGSALMDEFRKAQPGLPVLLMSGYLQDRLTPSAEGAKGLQFLQKPYRVEELLAKVETALKAR